MLVLCNTGCTQFRSAGKTNFSPVINNLEFQKVVSEQKIELIAPASGVERESIELLKSLPFMKLAIPQDLLNNSIVFHANSDQARLKFLKTALCRHSQDSIIWAIRGGYGSARLIEGLKKLSRPPCEKMFIGYSDITALHLFLSQQWHWKTIHGAGLAELLNAKKDPKNFEKIADLIAKKRSMITLNNLKPLNPNRLHSKKLSGLLTGGNLTIVASSIGTSWQIETAGKILFLEETGERGYRIDRTLNHLKQAGIFRKVKAIIFGEFTMPSDETVTLALERFAMEIKIPVFKTDEFGHGEKNYPLVYNAKSEIIEERESEQFSLNMRI